MSAYVERVLDELKKKNAAEHLFDACEPEIKLLLLDFCMCFIASDDTVSPRMSI